MARGDEDRRAYERREQLFAGARGRATADEEEMEDDEEWESDEWCLGEGA
jgi:hypothetical protein